MLVCKIEMWPRGDESRKREIGRVLIANVGGDEWTGHYDVVIPKSAKYAKHGGAWKRGRVVNFPRRRLGPVDLLLRALAACVGGRSPAVDGAAELGAAHVNVPDREATA